MSRPILIMAGGTGGHVYPALAAASYLRERGAALLWLGTRRGIETRVVPESGIELLTIRSSALRGKGLLRTVLAALELPVAVAQALLICLRRRPVLALGMGGFAAAPGGIAAWLLRIPLLIHEQNSIAGAANKALSRFAATVMQGFPGAFRDGPRVVTTGNPVRREILNLPDPAARRPGAVPGQVNVLVLGGSQGAHRLNQAAPAGLARLQQKLQVNVRHQCGRRDHDETRRRYDRLGLAAARVEPFITDMAAAYGWADVAVCRAGALTIAELCAAGLAAVLVPFPHAVDDHQAANARYLADAGAAWVLPEAELTGEKLAELLRRLCAAPGTLAAAAARARQRAFPDAAAAVGRLCLEHAHA